MGRMSKTITYDFWLTFAHTDKPQGQHPRASKGEPTVGRGERAVRCRVILPAALFATPSISMSVTVPELDRPVFEADVEAAAEDFKQAMGMDIDLRIIPAVEGGDA
jgi:hypothetical protein